MTPEQESALDNMMELVSSLANLTQQQANLIYEQHQQILDLAARLGTMEVIAKAKL
jgi:hypothetical protein